MKQPLTHKLARSHTIFKFCFMSQVWSSNPGIQCLSCYNQLCITSSSTLTMPPTSLTPCPTKVRSSNGVNSRAHSAQRQPLRSTRILQHTSTTRQKAYQPAMHNRRDLQTHEHLPIKHLAQHQQVSLLTSQKCNPPKLKLRLWTAGCQLSEGAAHTSCSMERRLANHGGSSDLPTNGNQHSTSPKTHKGQLPN